jgi:hypothetical protein
MLSPLLASAEALNNRWRTLTESITRVLRLDYGTLQVRPEYINGGVWSGFVGAACERVSRDRGSDAFVAPLAELSRGKGMARPAGEVGDRRSEQASIFISGTESNGPLWLTRRPLETADIPLRVARNQGLDRGGAWIPEPRRRAPPLAI